VTANPTASHVIARRAVTALDDAFLRTLYASTRDDLDVLGWTDEQRSGFCAGQWAAQRAAYRSAHPLARDEIVEVDGVAVGRLLVDATGGDVTVVDVALVPDARGHGVGSRLLGGVLEAARAQERRVTLYVLGSNPALLLYLRLGFVVVGEQGLHLQMAWMP
jgi:ribosomal protein S18 acetylase RimI-like enzyme